MQLLLALLAPLRGCLAMLPSRDLPRLLWACAELQVVPPASLLAEALEVAGDAMDAAAADAMAVAAADKRNHTSTSTSTSSRDGNKATAAGSGSGSGPGGGAGTAVLLDAGGLALLVRSLAQLGVAPDAAWQVSVQMSLSCN